MVVLHPYPNHPTHPQASDDAKPRTGLRIGGQPGAVEVPPKCVALFVHPVWGTSADVYIHDYDCLPFCLLISNPPPPQIHTQKYNNSGGLTGTVTNALRRWWGGNGAEAAAPAPVFYENLELE